MSGPYKDPRIAPTQDNGNNVWLGAVGGGQSGGGMGISHQGGYGGTLTGRIPSKEELMSQQVRMMKEFGEELKKVSRAPDEPVMKGLGLIPKAAPLNRDRRVLLLLKK